MSKSSRREARRLRVIEEARLRFANGKATAKDIDMLARMVNEANGKDGYTGESRGSSSLSSEMIGSKGYFVRQGRESSYSGYNPNPSKGPAYPTFHVSQPKDEYVFKCAEISEITDKCPLNPKVPSILVSSLMWHTWMRLAKDIDTEWIALLKGKLDKDDEGNPAYLIDGYYFPPQTAGGAHVDIPTGVRPKAGTIGAVHSHVRMGVFFSGTDIAHSNWPVEIVINAREEYEAVARHQLKCGEYAKSKSTVYLTSVATDKVREALEVAFTQGKGIEQNRRTKPSDKDEPKATVTVYTGSPGPDHNLITRDCACGHGSLSHHLSETIMGASKARELTWCRVKECRCMKYYAKVDPTPSNDNKEEDTQSNTTSPTTQTSSSDTKPSREANQVAETVVDSNESLLEAANDAATEDMTGSLSFPYGEGMVLDVDEYSSEEYCEECEGTGWVDCAVGYTQIPKKCEKCGGDGLSEVGRVRKAERERGLN
jgi:hypothetical protein